MLHIVENKEFDRLPGQMAHDGSGRPMNTLLHTRDGQLCDVIVDKAALGRNL